jgi:hypothetical protein
MLFIEKCNHKIVWRLDFQEDSNSWRVFNLEYYDLFKSGKYTDHKTKLSVLSEKPVLTNAETKTFEFAATEIPVYLRTDKELKDLVYELGWLTFHLIERWLTKNPSPTYLYLAREYQKTLVYNNLTKGCELCKRFPDAVVQINKKNPRPYSRTFVRFVNLSYGLSITRSQMALMVKYLNQK